MFIKWLTFFVFCLLSTFTTTTSVIADQVESKARGKVLGIKTSVKPSWFKESFLDFREDAEDAATAGKHMLVFVDLKGCPYCAQMLKDNFNKSAKKGGNLEFIKTNFDSIHLDLQGDREVAFDESTEVSESDLAKALKVRFTPTILFMSANNKVVARVNGYRSAREFRQVLNYVHEKAYEKTDFPSYRQEHLNDSVYSLLGHDAFVELTDFSKAIKKDKPLAILFEDKTCDECERFHKEVLDLSLTKSLMNKMNFVRLDALSDKEIIDVDGNKTTASDWLKKLNISYRPSMLLFADGKKIETLSGLIKSFHFQQLLSYAIEEKHLEYPDFISFGSEYSARVLETGKNIDIWK